MTARRSVTVVTVGFVLAVAAVGGGAGAAIAHDQLVAASPAEGTAVEAVSEVTLTFSGELLGGGTGGNLATVTGPDGRFHETACADVDGFTLTLPVALGEAGEYRVDWRAVSSDGHPISGSYDFAYEPAVATGGGTDEHPCADVPTPEQPAAGDTDSDGAAPGQAVPGGSSSDTAVDPEPSLLGGSGLLIGLALGGGVLVAVAAAVVVILRRRT